MAAARVGVVVVTYNGRPWIDACLNSVKASGSIAVAIVVDNASTDGCADHVAQSHPKVQLLRSAENLGFGRGNNLGIVEALRLGCDYVLLLNQDAYLLPGSLQAMVDFLDADVGFGACSPLHCSPDDAHLDRRTFRNYLTSDPSSLLMDALLGQTKHSYAIDGLNAALWMMRAEVFRRVGGFDPLFFMYGEDDDLLARLRHHGVRFALLTQIRAVHQRQSPPAARTGWRADMKRRKSRLQARWMAAMKKPGHSLSYAITLLIARGFLRPLADFVEHRNTAELLSSWWAFASLWRRLPAIRRHTRLTRQPGPHFLPGL